MITDTNDIIALTANNLVGAVGGDWTILAILFIAGIGMALVYSRAKSGTSIAVMSGVIMMFSFVQRDLMFLWWLAIIASLFVLVNGIRKWITSQA